MNLCLICQVRPCDGQARVYQNVNTGHNHAGTRNFCSDGCEQVYFNRMKRTDPRTFNKFIRIA